MFTIHQFRLGLATNSSSNHSIIFLPGGAEDERADGDFGWQFFTAASPKSKNLYAALQLRGAMHWIAGKEVAQTVAQNWMDVELGDADDYEEYIDHQSQWSLPLDWEGKSIDREFFEELRTFLLRKDVVILGGNDNDEEAHPLDDGSAFQLPLPHDRRPAKMVARKEEGYWVLFNRTDGRKIRMSFEDPSKSVEPTKATAPELVDVKITNFCPHGCGWCYQDSSSEGQHADRYFIGRLASAFREMKVFEVALGGGEPTLHPDFVRILEWFREAHVVPNFTTRNLDWLRNHRRRQQILKLAGAFAYSITTPKEIDELASLQDVYGIPDEQIGCQYVMGSTPLYYFEKILERAASREMRITLLGYKTNGRGKQFEPSDYKSWLTVLKKVHDSFRWGPRIGIDTALARDYQGQLADMGIPRWSYEIEEGKFSMYVDAVAKKVAKASYGPDLEMCDLRQPDNYVYLQDELLSHFARF